MLRVLGSDKRLCDGTSRRDFLQAGALGVLGLTATDLLRAAGTASGPAARSFGKAKSCILLFLYGSPSQLETFDPKPDSAEEIRGELKDIPSCLPGVRVGELIPRIARVLDKTTIVRSVTHPYPIHGVAYATTAIEAIDVAMELSPRDGRHWPFLGSVVDYLTRKPGRVAEVPTNLALPFPFSSKRVGEVPRAGPYAAFLGNAYNPIWTEFKGQATGQMTKTLQEQVLDVAEPYIGVSDDSHFELASAADPAT